MGKVEEYITKNLGLKISSLARMFLVQINLKICMLDFIQLTYEGDVRKQIL